LRQASIFRCSSRIDRWNVVPAKLFAMG
jgi:hypothetical protein